MNMETITQLDSFSMNYCSEKGDAHSQKYLLHFDRNICLSFVFKYLTRDLVTDFDLV